MGTALLLALAVGVPIGLMAAIRQYSALDYASAVVSLATISTPSFFLGLAAIYVFSLKLNLLPTSGMFTAGSPRSLGDDLHHLILPAAILGLNLAGPFVALRPLEPARSDSPGLPDDGQSQRPRRTTVVLRHAFPNALDSADHGRRHPGAGAVRRRGRHRADLLVARAWARLALASITQRDYPVLMGFILIIAVLVLLSNLLADIAYAVVDPRIRLQ